MTHNEIILIAGMVAVTFSIRYILLALADKFELPSLLKQALSYVPPAVLTAITVPAILMTDTGMDLSLRNPYLIGALAAVAAGVISKKLMVTIVTGMVVFFIYRFLF